VQQSLRILNQAWVAADEAFVGRERVEPLHVAVADGEVQRCLQVGRISRCLQARPAPLLTDALDLHVLLRGVNRGLQRKRGAQTLTKLSHTAQLRMFRRSGNDVSTKTTTHALHPTHAH
jgi:hypothetical protein